MSRLKTIIQTSKLCLNVWETIWKKYEDSFKNFCTSVFDETQDCASAALSMITRPCDVMVKILDKAVCISYYANKFWKGMHLFSP